VIDDITRLLTEYCEAIDAGDFDRVGALFEHGALFDPDGGELARGADAVAAFYRHTVRLHDGSPRTKHFVVDTVVTDDRSRSVYVVLQDERPIVAGRYHDRFVEVDGRLRFAERRFFVDLIGDISRHLTERSSNALG
jgi:hypothetical protein